jgi:Flp pilus assembly pilin Flp
VITQEARDATTARVVRTGLIVASVAVVLQSAAHVVNEILDQRWNALNADSDTGAAAWASASLQFGAALMVLVLAARAPNRRWLAALGVALAFLSLDDIIRIHEQVAVLDERLGLWEHAGRLLWVGTYLPLLGGVFLGLWAIAAETAGELPRLIRIGLGLLVFAVFLEVAGAGLYALDVERLDPLFVAEVTVEEGVELFGWALITTALTALIAGRPQA